MTTTKPRFGDYVPGVVSPVSEPVPVLDHEPTPEEIQALDALLPAASRGRGRPRSTTRPICQREGCENETASKANKFCSYECRNVALADVYRRLAQERGAKVARQNGSTTSPELKEAFRLAFAKVPSGEWPEPARIAYNDYVKEKRRRQKERREQARQTLLQRLHGDRSSA